MNGKTEEEKIQRIPLDTIVEGCIFHFNKEVMNRKQTPALFYEFREHLAEAIRSVPPPPKGETSIAQMSFMLEDFIRGVSRIIVSISSIAPTVWGREAGLSEDQTNLVRRGMEEHLLNLTEQMLRKHILNDHIEFNNFSPTKEGS